MALFELKLQQTFAGQMLVNTFAYQSTGTPAAVSLSFALAAAFGAIPDAGVYPPNTVLQAIVALQHNTLTYDLVTVRDPYSVTDFYETPFNPTLAGVQGGDSMSPTAALGFRTNRVRSDIRRGTKRFGGMAEVAFTSGGGLASAVLAQVDLIATRLGEVLQYDDEGNTITFTPIIVGKQRYNPSTGEPDPEGSSYRWYPTPEEQLQHIAAGILWDRYDMQRTQTSRQYGRGQ